MILFVQKLVQLEDELPELVQNLVQQQCELVQLVEVLVQLALRAVLVAGKIQQRVEQVQQSAGTDLWVELKPQQGHVVHCTQSTSEVAH